MKVLIKYCYLVGELNLYSAWLQRCCLYLKTVTLLVFPLLPGRLSCVVTSVELARLE